MHKFSSLIRRTSKYALICEARLRADMAKRIMFSILPSLSGMTQTSLTEGVVDYKALNIAIEGRKEIIRLSTKACAHELTHYQKTKSPIVYDVAHNTRKYLDKNDYETILTVAIAAFTDVKSWEYQYGGEPWAKIAKITKQIYDLDKQLTEVRQNKTTEKDWEDELKIMRELVIDLNVFDGLSHNTASIMRNLVQQEHEELTNGVDMPDIPPPDVEFDKIQDMMDAKELTDPVHVFKEIEKTLKGSGDINRFKDWVRRLRQAPSYLQDDPEQEKEKVIIRLRKALIPSRQKLRSGQEQLQKIPNQINNLSSNNSEQGRRTKHQVCQELRSSLQGLDDGIYYLSREVDDQLNRNRNEISNKLLWTIKNKTSELIDKTRNISITINDIMWENDSYPHDQETIKRLLAEAGILFSEFAKLIEMI